jgi:hypothetical protein
MATTTAGVFDLDRNFAVVNRQWDALFTLCDKPTAFHASAPTVSGWGVDRHVSHVGIALGRIADAIEGMLADPGMGAGLKPTHPFAMPLLEGGSIPRGVGKAPEILIPPAAPTPAETRAQLQFTKARWDELATRRDDIAANPATFAHFVMGNYSGVQWVRFITIHTAHHFKIIRDILGAARQDIPYDAGAENVN